MITITSTHRLAHVPYCQGCCTHQQNRTLLSRHGVTRPKRSCKPAVSTRLLTGIFPVIHCSSGAHEAACEPTKQPLVHHPHAIEVMLSPVRRTDMPRHQPVLNLNLQVSLPGFRPRSCRCIAVHPILALSERSVEQRSS